MYPRWIIYFKDVSFEHSLEALACWWTATSWVFKKCISYSFIKNSPVDLILRSRVGSPPSRYFRIGNQMNCWNYFFILLLFQQGTCVTLLTVYVFLFSFLLWGILQCMFDVSLIIVILHASCLSKPFWRLKHNKDATWFRGQPLRADMISESTGLKSATEVNPWGLSP